jgi:hypothetical protein
MIIVGLLITSEFQEARNKKQEKKERGKAKGYGLKRRTHKKTHVQ